jgi:hypothetical protein
VPAVETIYAKASESVYVEILTYTKVLTGCEEI